MSMFRIVVAVSAFYAAVAERAHDENNNVLAAGKQDPDERELPAQIAAHFSCDADNEALSSCDNTMFNDEDHAETCWADEARQDCDVDSQGAYDLVMLEGNSYCTYKALFKLGTFKGVSCRQIPGEEVGGEILQKLAEEEQKNWVKEYVDEKIKTEKRNDQVKEYIASKIQDKVDARQQEVKDYMRDQIKKNLGGEGAGEDADAQAGEGEDADAEASGGDPEDLEGGDMSAIEELEKDLAAMNEFHDHDDMMRKELEELDLMDETVVEELGKYSENLAKCMFRCIHSAHRYFSAEDAAKEACECTKTDGTELCDECQYLSDDKIKDEEGSPIEVESAHAKGHLSASHFQGTSSRGRCVMPGEVGEARKINFRGTVIQC